MNATTIEAASDLHLKTDHDGDPQFRVRVQIGNWSVTRVVTVVDRSISIKSLMSRIAHDPDDDDDDWDNDEYYSLNRVTEPNEDDGYIFFKEGGRRYLVATWRTCNDHVGGDVNVFFGTGGKEISADDLDHVRIVRTVEEE